MNTPLRKHEAGGPRPLPAFMPLLCLLVLCFAGCGADYRAQVEKTRQRMTLLDEENALLEGAASFPPSETPIFFRPPRGVAVQPSAKAYPPSDWLNHLAWNERRFLAPPLEVFVGAAKKQGAERLEDFLQNKVLEYLRQHADERLTARPGEAPRDLTLTRQTDPPQERRPIPYRHFAYRSEQESPQWPAPDRPRLPQRCTYHYDVYLTDSAEQWGVVVFKSLNIEATLDAWRKAAAPSELIMRLPQKSALQMDPATGLETKECSLATLIIGARARARLRLLER